MDPEQGHDACGEGWRLLEAGEWDAARQAFETALSAEPTPDARDGLGYALYYLGRTDEGIAARALAFAEYVKAGRCDDAARVAVWVSHAYAITGQPSAARGWLSRAERAVEGAECGVGQGWVAVERARHAKTLDESVEHARRSLEIARDCGATELEIFALSVLGRSEVSAGRREEGMKLLEEAMAGASAGRLRDVHTLGEAYCNLIIACTNAGEWEQAAEWCEVVGEYAQKINGPILFGACRTAHADVLVATGRWPEAEQALETARTLFARHAASRDASSGPALAELRIRQGRLGEARELLTGREENPSSLRALALLRIAENQPAVAAALLQRGLAETADDVVRTAQLLAPLVEARLACGDTEAAEKAAEGLRRLARDSSIRLVEARAELATAQVHLAAGRARDAAEAARCALGAFSRLAMPFDTSEARLVLARAVAADTPGLAAEEARAAFDTFRDLGATRAMDATAELLRDLGTPAGGAEHEFRREGEYWTIAFDGEEFRMKDSKGLQYLAELLANPGTEIHVLDLVGGAGSGDRVSSTAAEVAQAGMSVSRLGDAGEVLDAEAKAAYRSRLAELEGELEEARNFNDPERTARLTEEMDALRAELAGAVGLGERDRKLASPSERARVNVTRTIRNSMGRIEKSSPALADHLAKTIRTGTFCAYLPAPGSRVSWRL